MTYYPDDSAIFDMPYFNPEPPEDPEPVEAECYPIDLIELECGYREEAE